MFTSATLKLTAWYLLILVTICLIFSFIIFELSTSEISSRLERLQIRVEGSERTVTLPGPLTLTDVRVNQTEEARASIFVGLVYMNLAVVSLGGIGSFILARRTLRPIEEAHEAQSRFTSDASHELRTPLAVMKSEIQVALRDDAMKGTDYRELMSSTLEEVDKLTQLSHSLLQLSRLDYGEIRRTDRIDLVATIKRSAQSLKIPKARLSYEVPPQPIYVDGDQTTISDLLSILLDNAVKYSPEDSPISVSVSSNGRHCKISVANEGAGISKAELPRIFDRFYRTEKSRSSSQTPGYGLGLPLAKRIVQLHDGTLSAASNPGGRTVFTVQLPQVRKNR
jgi:signal transduction histidine kinase